MPLKGGNLFIQSVEINRDTVSPGDTVAVRVEAANGALAISPGDADACSSDVTPCPPVGFLQTKGYCAGVRMALDGAEHTDEACIQIALSGVGTHVFETGLPAPTEPGTYDVTATLTATGSGESETQTRTITVVAPDGNGDGGNGGNGDGNGDGGNGGDGDRPFGLTDQQTLGVAAGAAILLGVMALVGGDDG